MSRANPLPLRGAKEPSGVGDRTGQVRTGQDRGREIGGEAIRSTHLCRPEVKHSRHDAALFGLQLRVQDVLAVLVQSRAARAPRLLTVHVLDITVQFSTYFVCMARVLDYIELNYIIV